MKQIVKGVIMLALACIVPGFAMDKPCSPRGELKPLKFTIDERGAMGDADGSCLIKNFESSVDVIKRQYEDSKSAIEQKVQKLDAELSQTPETSKRRSACEAYKNKLRQRDKELDEWQKEFGVYRHLLNQALRVIYGRSPLKHCSGSFCWAIPNIETLKKEAFETLELDFSCAYGEEGAKHLGKSYIEFLVKGEIPSDLREQLDHFLYTQPFTDKLKQIQDDIFKLSESICEDGDVPLNSMFGIMKILPQFVSSHGDEDARIKESEELRGQARDIMIKLEPIYWMAQIIMAFQEEVFQHRDMIFVNNALKDVKRDNLEGILESMSAFLPEDHEEFEDDGGYERGREPPKGDGPKEEEGQWDQENAYPGANFPHIENQGRFPPQGGEAGGELLKEGSSEVSQQGSWSWWLPGSQSVIGMAQSLIWWPQTQETLSQGGGALAVGGESLGVSLKDCKIEEIEDTQWLVIDKGEKQKETQEGKQEEREGIEGNGGDGREEVGEEEVVDGVWVDGAWMGSDGWVDYGFQGGGSSSDNERDEGDSFL